MLRPPTARAFRLSLFSNQYLKSLVAANRRRRLLRGSDIVSVYRQVLDRDARRLVDPSSHGVLLARVAAANHWPTTHSYCTSTADSLGRRSRETATTTFCRRSVPPGILLLDITVSYTLYLTSTVSFQNECLIFTREIGKMQSDRGHSLSLFRLRWRNRSKTEPEIYGRRFCHLRCYLWPALFAVDAS
jgi:hypothetical protein